MNFLKTIFCGVLIAGAVSTLVAMDMDDRPAIDCLAIQTKEALVNALKHNNLLDEAFELNEGWKEIPGLVTDIWKHRLDRASKQSILDAHTRINSGSRLTTPGASPVSLTKPGLTKLREWIASNKGKSLGIGIVTLGLVDIFQAYCRADKATWKESDLKGKLELVKRKMLIMQSINVVRNFATSRCT